MVTKDDCVFCKIGKGEIDHEKIWEDENYIAFLDQNPFCKGHTLVIPKEHSRWVWDLNNKQYSEFLLKVKEVALLLGRYFDTEWIEEIIAGVGVEHTHVHLLPRRFDDGLKEIPKEAMKPKPSTEELNKLAEEIRKNGN